MGEKTTIEWTDNTWNPVTGCTWKSPGCDNCYAAVMSKRLEGMGQEKYTGLTTPKHFNGVVKLHPESLEIPFKWKKPKRVFVNSMSDLFHKDVPFEFIDRVLAVVYECHWLTFQVLTKRPGRMADYFFAEDLKERVALAVYHRLKESQPEKATLIRPCEVLNDLQGSWPLPNLWLGTSVENQATADERIPPLIKTPATVRFISYEPALGPVNFFQDDEHHPAEDAHPEGGFWHHPGCLNYCDYACGGDAYEGKAIHWVIAGGESGPNARPAHPEWFRSVRDQCDSAGVPFFFKQWGEWGTLARLHGEPAFHYFRSHNDWVHHASTRVGGGSCVDLQGKILRNGADFQAAEYPVAVMDRIGKRNAGRILDGTEHHEFPEVSHG